MTIQRLDMTGFFNMPSKLTDAYRDKTILISGALGYIGSTLTQVLADVDCRILLLDQSEGASWIPKNKKAKFSIFYGDVSKRETWKSILQDVDYIFHLAALEYNKKEFDFIHDLEVNAISVMHMLEACRRKGIRPKIIFSSSANLFGLVDTLPVNEKFQSYPISLWSAHKLLAENYLRIYAQKHGIKSVILRLTNVYGPSVNQDAITNVIINKVIIDALAGKRLVLYANKNCERDYIFLKDAINAFLYAGAENNLSDDNNFYVIGSGEGKTIREVWQIIANKIKALIGRDVSVEFDASVKLEPFDMRNFVADTALFQKKTGWKPKVLLQDGIELTAKFLL